MVLVNLLIISIIFAKETMGFTIASPDSSQCWHSSNQAAPAVQINHPYAYASRANSDEGTEGVDSAGGR